MLLSEKSIIKGAKNEMIIAAINKSRYSLNTGASWNRFASTVD